MYQFVQHRIFKRGGPGRQKCGFKGWGLLTLFFSHFSPFIGANDVRKCPDEPEESCYYTGSQSTHRCCPLRVTLSKSALSTEHNQKQKVEPKLSTFL